MVHASQPDESNPTHVTWDLPCNRCGASLRGNAVASTCGACAEPVEASLQRWWMGFRPDHVRATIARGMRCIAVGMFILLACSAIFLLLLTTGSLQLATSTLLIVACFMVLPLAIILMGVVLMTTREEEEKKHAHLRPLRTTLRLLTLCSSLTTCIGLFVFLIVLEKRERLAADMQNSRETMLRNAKIQNAPRASELDSALAQGRPLPDALTTTSLTSFSTQGLFSSSLPSGNRQDLFQTVLGNSKIKFEAITQAAGLAFLALIPLYCSRTAARIPSATHIVQGRALALALPTIAWALPIVGGPLCLIVLPLYLLRVASVVDRQ